MPRRIIFTLFTLFVFSISAFAQDEGERAKWGLKDYEKAMQPLGDIILNAKTDSARTAAHAKFSVFLQEALNRPGSFDYPFDSIKNVSKLKSEDGKLRVFTWELPRKDETRYDHFGFIQVIKRKGILNIFRKATPKLIVLQDKSGEIEDPEYSKLFASKWYGALYYKLLQNKAAGKTYYTLLGFKPMNNKTTKKVIENIGLSGDKVTFGLPIFKDGNNIRNRVTFEYGAFQAMSLKFEKDIEFTQPAKPNPKKKRKPGAEDLKIIKAEDMIVFDHLVASNPVFEGQKEFYGPDLTFDAYKFEGGKWVLYSNIEVRNRKDPKKKNKPKYEYFVPKKK